MTGTLERERPGGGRWFRTFRTLAGLLGMAVLTGPWIGRTPGSAAEARPSWTLEGALVTPERVISRGTVSISAGRIHAIGDGPSAGNGDVVRVGGIILPGLIDLHNHITWNVLPRWDPPGTFTDRYEWQADPAYHRVLRTRWAALLARGLECEMTRYAEVKALVGGATAVVGSPFPDRESCLDGLVRNLDFASGFGEGEPYRLRALTFPFETDPGVLDFLRRDLAEGTLSSLLVHLAEGRRGDASARREFRMFQAQELLRPGVTIVHGTALGRAEFRAMSESRTGLVWSPRSNVELYGTTTDVRTARKEGVRIALAPDWSPTGSDGMLQELRYASAWLEEKSSGILNEAELIRMATSVPAELAGLKGRVGAIALGAEADLLVVAGEHDDPFRSLVHAKPEDVRLVVVGGRAVYGEPHLLEQLAPGNAIERIEVCGRSKGLNLDAATGPRGFSWRGTLRMLTEALEERGSSLAPLTVCTAS